MSSRDESDYGDNIARGYVTVDLVTECNLQFPSTPGYFTSVADFDNILWGDYFYVDPTGNFAQGETLVHIEADATNPETSVAGEYTFYGRYVNFDGREVAYPVAELDTLVPAFATTIHKSQGMTLDAAEIDLSKAFVEGMGYVGLSRVKNLDNLYLKGINQRALMVSREAQRIDAELRDKSRALA